MAPGKECKGMPPLVTHVSTRAPVSISISARQVSSRSAPPAFCFPAAHSQNDLPCLQKKKTNTPKKGTNSKEASSLFSVFYFGVSGLRCLSPCYCRCFSCSTCVVFVSFFFLFRPTVSQSFLFLFFFFSLHFTYHRAPSSCYFSSLARFPYFASGPLRPDRGRGEEEMGKREPSRRAGGRRSLYCVFALLFRQPPLPISLILFFTFSFFFYSFPLIYVGYVRKLALLRFMFLLGLS